MKIVHFFEFRRFQNYSVMWKTVKKVKEKSFEKDLKFPVNRTFGNFYLTNFGLIWLAVIWILHWRWIAEFSVNKSLHGGIFTELWRRFGHLCCSGNSMIILLFKALVVLLCQLTTCILVAYGRVSRHHLRR